MKDVDLSTLLHENTSDLTQVLVADIPEIKIVTKIDEALEARGLTKAKLAKLTGLRPTTVTELCKGERQMISKAHIASIMVALRITDIREIIDIEFDSETTEKFKKEAKSWKSTKEAPEEIKKIYRHNILLKAEAEAENDI